MFSFFRGGAAASADLASHDDLVEASQKGTCAIIDVREPGEFAAGRVPGARNMPLSRFDPHALPKDKPLILICQAGGRSARALSACRAAGLTDTRHYKPGTGGWMAQGGAIER
ncbi:rhodanese-like domain-containing protein [Rhizobiales bacterium TNE-4]|nr:rhodanese-like domain-containing protein [Rhizobiales bacterium TNE-4]MBV1828582.1 rhodanese-like domain-containing protein [Rhizobiales bacterium TNE-4]